MCVYMIVCVHVYVCMCVANGCTYMFDSLGSEGVKGFTCCVCKLKGLLTDANSPPTAGARAILQ